MAKFYDDTVYPLAETLLGDEVFVIHQSGQTRTTNFGVVLTDVIYPLLNNLTLDDMTDVSIMSPLSYDTLIYNNDTWGSGVRDYVMSDIQDVIVDSPQIKQMLIYNGSNWVNGNDPVLGGYTEIEYDIGLVSGTCNIDLANGNIQRLQVDGVLEIVLPTLPPDNINWNLTLKIISDGVNLPTFTSSDGSLKWYDGDKPTDLSLRKSMNIFEFTSDFTSSKIYGSKMLVSPYSLIVTSTGVLDNPNAYSTSQGDEFAWSVSMSESYSIVGTYQEDDVGGISSGKAYIFDNSTGNLLHTLDNPNAYGTSTGDQFGESVSITESYSIVGAYQEDDVGGTTSGKAYIFDNATGNLLHTLDNPTAYSTSAGDYFGNSVSISESYSIVGAYRENDVGGIQSGKAYIFDNSTGNLLHTLDNPNAYDASVGDQFGVSVSICESHSIVGTHWEDDAGGSNSGKAYIFDNATGNLLHTLDNPNAYDTSANDNFGEVVSISESYCIVGTPEEEGDSGRAYIFDNATGNLLHTLDNPNAYGTSVGDNFGISVSICESYSIVGTHWEDDAGGSDSGKAYIFDNASGTLLYTLDNSNAYGSGSGDEFGYSVAVTESYCIVGAHNEDDAGGTTSGKAYIFSMTDG